MITRRRLLYATASAMMPQAPTTALEAPNVRPVSCSVVIGWLASWKLGSDKSLASLPGDKLTHLLYAFGGVSADGRAVLADPCTDVGDCPQGEPVAGTDGAFGRLLEFRQRYPALRVLISIGGWKGSKYFSLAARSHASRNRFVRSVIEVFFQRHLGLFDGVDVDWEYPGTEGYPGNLVSVQDGENLTLLMQEMRRQFDQLSTANGREYELSLATPAEHEQAAHFEFPALSRIVNRFELMSYDYYAGATVAGFNAPLFASAGALSPERNVDASVGMLLAAGIPRSQIVLGLPFYGRAYSNVPPTNDGLFQAANPSPPASWGGKEGIDFRDLVARQPLALGFLRQWDASAKVPWLYNPASRIWISYDDVVSIEAKAAYAHSQELAGAAIWSLEADDGTLLPAVLAGLRK